MMLFCGVPKSLQANTVLVQKIKPRPLKFKEFKAACDLISMSHQSSSDQTPAYHGRIPDSFTTESACDLSGYRSNYGRVFNRKFGFLFSINIIQTFHIEIK